MFGRLRSKIIFSFCALMVGGGALSTTLVSRNMSRTLGTNVDFHGLALARVLADQLEEPLAYRDRLSVRTLLTGVQRSNPDVMYAFITDPSGVVRDHSFALGGFPEDLLRVKDASLPATLRTERGLVRDLSLPVTQGVLGTLHLGLSMTWVDAATRDAVRNVLMTTLIAMAAGILGILVLANLITRPVLALREAADRFGRGEEDAEAPVEGRDEIADLARTFNQMAAQIRHRIAESEALRAYVERVLDQMESSIIVVSAQRDVQYANRVALDEHGPLEACTCSSILGGERPCEECPVPEVLESGSVVHRRYKAPSGRSYELKWVPILGRDGKPAVVERALDVTERLEIEERLRNAQRLAVAGEIAAGVVHSVNNPLDGVRRALDLAESRPDDKGRVARMLALAKEGTDRIAGITRTLLGFARGEVEPDPIPVHIATLVSAAANLARLRAEARGVEIRTEVQETIPEAVLDPQGMEEVLVNLVLNAVDACEGGGTITISAHDRGDIVEISVEDTGPGISAESAKRVFEPFFTTKDAAQGTGLGLSVARRIVEAHGGELVLESGPSRGARFTVRLPYRPQPSKREAAVG